jgi:hypothetical protein
MIKTRIKHKKSENILKDSSEINDINMTGCYVGGFL